MAQGKYDAGKAPKLWRYHVDRAAKKYAKDHGGTFDKCTKDALARRWAREFRSAAMAGDYDKSDVPKKYAGKGLRGLKGRTGVGCRSVRRGGKRVTVCKATRAPSGVRRRKRSR
jgi:hypothetical protein